MRRQPRNRYIFMTCCMLLSMVAAGNVHAGGEPIFSSSSTADRPPVDGTISNTNDSVGLGIFSRLPFHVSVSVRSGYDDNVFTSSFDKQGSAFINSSIGLSYDFGSPRTRLSLQTGGGITYYFDRPGQQDPDYNAYLGLSLKHLFTPRLIFTLSAYAAYQIEPDFSFGTGFNRRSGNYFYTNDKATLSYLWTPRFSTATSYTFGALIYDSSSSAGVGSFENRIENTFGNEFRFLLWPTTTIVGEYRIEFVSYQTNNADSVTHFFLAGFDHTFSPRFSASFRGGFEIRSFDNGSVSSGDETSPYFEATLSYALGQQTSVAWTNRYGIEEPDVPGNPRRVTYRTGLNVKHNWTPRISSRASIYYEHDDYSGNAVSPAFVEDSFDLALSVRYAITRYFGVEVGYNHTEVISDISLRGYARNRIYAGADFSF